MKADDSCEPRHPSRIDIEAGASYPQVGSAESKKHVDVCAGDGETCASKDQGREADADPAAQEAAAGGEPHFRDFASFRLKPEATELARCRKLPNGIVLSDSQSRQQQMQNLRGEEFGLRFLRGAFCCPLGKADLFEHRQEEQQSAG